MVKPVTKLKSIEDTAIRLFTAKGIKKVTIKDIAREAGCSEGALYRHYSGKEEMALALYKHEIERFGALLENVLKGKGTFSERLSSAVGLFYRFFDEDPVKFAFILLSEHHFPAKNKLNPEFNPHNLVFKFIFEGVKNGDFKTQDSELAASMLLGLVLQPATLRATGRLDGMMSDKKNDVVEACLKVLDADNEPEDKSRKRKRKFLGFEF